MRATRTALAATAALLLCLLAAGPAAHAAEAPTPEITAGDPRTERLAHLARLWGTVRYLHPYLAYRDLDWDAAALAALPRVRAATTTQDYAAAVQEMLGRLGDPVTRLLPPARQAAGPAGAGTVGVPAGAAVTGSPPGSLFQTAGDGLLVIDLHPRPGVDPAGELFSQIGPLRQAIAGARGVVLDLRSGGNPEAQLDPSFAVGYFQDALVRRPARAPAQRFLMHSGYRPQTGGTSGGYWSGFVTLAADSFAPAPAGAPQRVVFIVEPDTALPSLALALQAAGDGFIVAAGSIGERSAVTAREVDLGEGLTAAVRVSELVPLPGWPGVHADVQVAPAAGGADPAMAAALRLAGEAAAGVPPPPADRDAAPAAAPLPDAVWRPDPTYPEMLAPDLDHRLLAVFRFWNVIDRFYPYKHLIGDWDAVLPEFLGRMEEDLDGRGYALTLAEMGARIPDGHTSVGGHPELKTLFGEAGIGVRVRPIEGVFAVTELAEDPAVRAAGIEVGDVLEAVDGEPVEARAARLARYVAAATPAFLRERLADLLTAGPDGSTAVLALRGPGGPKEVRLPRRRELRYFEPAAAGEVVRVLPGDIGNNIGNIGYVDLTRLTPDGVDAMFERLRGTRALIFDLRGYPNGTAWSIAPRINTRNARVGALFRRAQVSGLSLEEDDAGYFFAQPMPPLPPEPGWKYTGRTVMLIDARAISQSEHTGLFFEAANGTQFIGTATAGSNGDVTTFTLPGNVRVVFTGHDVRHADGRQLQRVGLVPDVEVAPTLAGLRAGRDEVLERAVRYLSESEAPAGGQGSGSR